MLWIGLHLPLLSLETFAATLAGTDASRPIALIDAHRVAAANEAARRLGVNPRMKRTTALALAPGLLCGEADAARDADALLALAQAALAFTPAVSLEPSHGVVLEVQPSLRFFGGLDALLERLRATLRPLGHACRIACAPTALGAALLARWRDGFDRGAHVGRIDALRALLDDAPVWLLGPGREHWEALQGMGLATIGDLRRLPRAGLARRFGEALIADLDRALGSRADPRDPVVLPAEFASRLELYARADTAEQVLAAAGVLLERLIAWARARQARISRFTLVMQHEPRHRHDSRDPPQTPLQIALAEPTADAAHLRMLLRERLARSVLPAPTLELRLQCRDVVHAPAPNGELFPSARNGGHEGLVRLIERLQARLGRERVLRLMPLDDHRPERSSACLPIADAVPAPAAAVNPIDPSARMPVRPIWLLPEPQPLAEQRSQPVAGGQPLQLLAGPERIEAGWWDASLAARDYFIARDAGGALLWIYRARLPASAEQDGWFLQGWFG